MPYKAREQALQMVQSGLLLSLEFRGLAEKLYWATGTARSATTAASSI